MNPWVMAALLGGVGFIGYKAISGANTSTVDTGAQSSSAGSMPVFMSSMGAGNYGAASGLDLGSGGYAAASMPVSPDSNVFGLTESLAAGAGLINNDSQMAGITNVLAASAGLTSPANVPLDNMTPASVAADTNAANNSQLVTTGVQIPQAVPSTDSGTQMFDLLSKMYSDQQTTNQQILSIQQYNDQATAKQNILSTSANVAAMFLDSNKTAAGALGVTVNPTADGGYNLYAITDKKQAADVLAPGSALAKTEQFNYSAKEKKAQEAAAKKAEAAKAAAAKATAAKEKKAAAAKAAAEKKAAAAKAAADKKAAAAKVAADKKAKK